MTPASRVLLTCVCLSLCVVRVELGHVADTQKEGLYFNVRLCAAIGHPSVKRCHVPIQKHGVVVRQAEADYAFTSRVHVLFQRVLRKFKGDLALWVQYVEFCQRVVSQSDEEWLWSVTTVSWCLCVQKHDFALGRVLAQALAVHPSASGLWVLAARTQVEQNRDIAAARCVT